VIRQIEEAMMSVTPIVPRYGVLEQTPVAGEIECAAERLRLVGYAIIESGLSTAERAAIADGFERVRRTVIERYGHAALQAIDEHNSIRAPLALDDVFLRLAQNDKVLRLCDHVFRSAYVLNQQNGIVNPPHQRYNQGAYHRDLPYQHFVASRPIAINALYCIDAFTVDNGCTKVIPGTHKEEAFPSDPVVRELEMQLVAPAGSFLVLDCLTYHCGGDNRTPEPRRAVNHLFALPFIKQQLDFRTLLSGRSFPERTRRLLGLDDTQPAADIDTYYARRQAKKKSD
jgi:ectoine hydroxylase-related dioxygenase (phytanoyl-CoA dioxygenase family)